MTRRAVALGLLGVAGLAAVTFYNNHVLQNTNLIHSYLPVGVFGGTLLFVLAVNPLLRRLGDRASLSGAELGGIIALLMFACGIVGSGLLEHVTTTAMMPMHWERTQPAWKGDPPELAARDLRDGPGLAAALAAADRAGDDVAAAFARRLPPGLPAAPVTDSDSEAGRAWRAAINAAIRDPALADEVAPARRPAALPAHARRWAERPAAGRTPAESAALNRALLAAALPEFVAARRPGALELAPPGMLADPARPDPATALDGFVTGLAQGQERLPVSRVPWAAWRRPFLFWGPLFLAASVMAIGLALVLHRQWSVNERLPYPTVEFVRALLPEEGRTRGRVFGERFFWVGFLAVLAVHLLNYAHVWYPDYVIPVNRTIDLSPLLEVMPVFRDGNPYGLFRPTLYFTAIGFAFFLSSDVSLSLGVAPYLYVLAAGFAARLGLAFGYGHLQLNIDAQLYAGGYTALFLTILYSGRQYYGAVARRALGRSARDAVDAGAVWGARAAALGFAVFVAQLVVAGVETGTALVYALGTVMIFTTISRLLAEAGVFFLHQHFYPCALIWSFLGTTAVGYEQMLVLGLVTCMLLIDPREALMPFVVTGLQLADRARTRTFAVARWGVLGVGLALLVATPVMLYHQYRGGAIQYGAGWFVQSVPSMAFNRAVSMTQSLQAQGALERANAIAGTAARLRAAAPRPALAIAFGVTFGLVLLFTFLRHRFARWPFHPLIFLVLGTFQSRMMGFSFLLGWAVKALVMKYGGARAYQRMKPLMIGVVGGEVLAAFVPLLVGAVYTLVLDRPAPTMRILP